MSPRVYLLALTLAIIILHIGFPTETSSSDIKKAIALNKQGENLLTQGKYSAAEEKFKLMLDSCGANAYCEAIARFYLGRCYVESARFNLAEGFLDDAEKRFDALNKKNEKAMVILNKGKLCVGRGDYKTAIKYFDQAEADFLAEKNNKELFPVYNNRAVALTYLCRYDQALDSLKKAEQLIQGSEAPAMQAVLKSNFGLLHSKRQEHKQALECFQQALDYYQDIGNPAAMVTVLNNIGHVHESASQYTEALKRHEEALNLSLSLGDQAGEALCLNNLGCVKLRIGDYEGAKAAFQLSLEKRNQLGIRHFASETLNNLGLVRLSRGDYTQAMADFELAEEGCTAVGSSSCRAWTLHNRAFLLKDMGKFKESSASSEEAISIAQEIGDRRLEATATLRLGNLYEYEGWFDRATQQYVKAAEVQQDIGDLYFKANTFSDIANILAREGDCSEAENFYRKALKTKQSIGAPQVETLCKMAIFLMEKNRYCGKDIQQAPPPSPSQEEHPNTPGECLEMAKALIQRGQELDQALLTYTSARYRLESDPKAALAEFDQLHSMSEKMGIRKYAFLASVGQGLAYEKLGDWEKARKAFKEAVDYAEQIRESLDEQARLKFLEGEEALGVKHILPYEALARVLMRLGKNEESLQVSEYTKSRNFSEALARRAPDSNADTPKEILERDAQLNNLLAGLLRGLEQAQLNHATETVSSLKRDIENTRMSLNEHIATLRSQYPLFASTKYPQPIPLESIALNDKEWVLTYEVTDTGVLIYLVQGTKLVKSLIKPISRGELDGMVRQFRQPMEVVPGKDTIADKLRSFDFQTGKKLADILVTDMLAGLPNGTPVIIVPDDCLGTLPFEMLPLNGQGRIVDDGRFVKTSDVTFFGDRNEISYYQSLTALTLARTLAKKQPSGKGLLVIADPVFHALDARAITSEPATRFARQDQQFNTALMEAIEATSMGSFKLERLPLTSELAESLADTFDQDAT
ncbi:MAG: tetratricopeptide repeat protein, partial [Deltaproteobacteria bacterium]|nr:tetratricopeptide repeat protein [Deltaproteobacteria bacterium]